jgi:hypothetical protein
MNGLVDNSYYILFGFQWFTPNLFCELGFMEKQTINNACY